MAQRSVTMLALGLGAATVVLFSVLVAGTEYDNALWENLRDVVSSGWEAARTFF